MGNPATPIQAANSESAAVLPDGTTQNSGVPTAEDATAKQKESDKEEMLKLMGVNPSKESNKELKLHSEVVDRWKVYLLKGIDEDLLKNLSKKYPREGNCHLGAPILNEEMEEGMAASALKRDKYFVDSQNINGSALSVIGQLMTDALDGKEISNLTLIEKLNDVAMLLTHQRHCISESRRAFITPGCKKYLQGALNKTESETYLYGSDLLEKIKKAKEIQKASFDIRNQLPAKNINTKSLNERRPSAYNTNTRQAAWKNKTVTKQNVFAKNKQDQYQPRFRTTNRFQGPMRSRPQQNFRR